VTPPAAAPAVAPRPGVAPRRRPPAPPRPRRVSGPARPRHTQPRARPAATERGLVRTLPAAVGRLADHPLVDRLLAGKAWIAVIAFALIGIVTLQLLLLQLNRSIGHDLAREGVLQRQNATLAIENSEMALGERIQREAGKLGMTLVPSGTLRFLAVHKGATAKAAAALSTPVVQAPEGGESASATGSEQSGESSGEGSGAGGEASTSAEGSESSESSGGEAASSSESTRSSETEASGGAERGESHTSASGEAPATETSSGGGTSSAPAG
jgi:hypothetical protein